MRVAGLTTTSASCQSNILEAYAMTSLEQGWARFGLTSRSS
jgi:hypothetical protein